MASPHLTMFGADAGRAREILEVLARYGIAEQSARRLAAADGDTSLATKLADPDLVKLDAGARLTAAFTELGTTWIKLGQSLSMRADLVGKDVAEALAGLQAEVPADPPGKARERVEADLGAPVTELFASFDDEPFASGSVAQAHHAVLKDGTPAVVKVLHFGAEEKVRGDLDLMRKLARFAESADPELARFHPTKAVEQFAEMMTQAVDLRNELGAMQRFAAELSEFDWLLVPKPFPELSAEGVLTMEQMSGSSLRTAADVTASGWSVNALTQHVTNAWMTMIFDHGLYHADPHPGNFLVPDSEHVVLLDYGDVGYLAGPRRNDVIRLLTAVVGRDVSGLTDVIIVVCNAPASTDVKDLEMAIDKWMAQYLPEDTASADIDLSAAMNACMQLLHEKELSFPSDLAMLVRVMARLEGFGIQIGSTVTMEEYLGPYLREHAKKENSPQRLFERFVRSTSNWTRMASGLPRDLEILVQQLRNGDTRLEINLRDPDELTDKLVDGLMASSSLLAASQLLANRTGPTIRGVSIAGLAAAGLAAVTWRNLSVRRTSHVTVTEEVLKLAKRAR
ncbi:Probable ubiquinone biosynthesis protein UbiB [Brevibacterium casei]|uniref:Probable ubiquinone biosynthesis protein UbiB n=1 Tax=Brevibacterium casei TaxID=33889 RepID=A0A449CZ97_9MICO|nr:AarF/UbiB family protein [Brevibacterium casei]VEW10657.1 Probable ubiquinone biosynthesis protein UbiB [Brevibacterium casei]